MHSPPILLGTPGADHAEKMAFRAKGRIREPLEQIPELHTNQPRSARRVLPDVDRGAQWQIASKADRDAVSFCRYPHRRQRAAAGSRFWTCRCHLRWKGELPLSHARHRCFLRSRIAPHIRRRHLPAPDCQGGLVDSHPAGRTAKLREITRLDVAALNSAILDPGRPGQWLSRGARVIATTCAKEDLTHQYPEEDSGDVPPGHSIRRCCRVREAAVTGSHSSEDAVLPDDVECSCVVGELK
jgi:hypothetical protein